MRRTDSEPVAVVDRDMVASPVAARAGGVRRRMRLRSAQACSPRLRVVERDLVAEVRAFERVAAPPRRWARQTAGITPHA
ncbi:hypothetical protein [Streptomyces sp. YU58]|uniref:hypothetical protein n=1 Tax=Streptomyces sp. SX92 TaxID=3158972 RepID=UPI0027B88026|nr:hypothetical protein [Streptomyces coralus]WLW58798.1 hypothetical protein QU709_44790 [Streptomyces coralus]